MEPERWKQIDQLLETALDCPASERGAFLDQACAGDAALRRELEALLNSDGQAGSFIESPAFEVAAELLAKDQSRSLVGQHIGRYPLLSLLGTGGMGEVYLAQDIRLDRQVALKLLPESFTRDQERVRRFEQEARAASRLSHPNICVIHEVSETDHGHHFITMEYIDGVTLRQHMAGPQMSLGETLDVAIQVASGLSAAHQAGIVHRDIKPENIMLRTDSYVKVLDFGLAKLTEKQHVNEVTASPSIRAVETDTDVVMGTARYMSPEQARRLDVDGRSDIWSLGVVLYEIVAGHAPFEGDTNSDVIVSILEREPKPVTQHGLEVSAELQRIITRALQKDREKRYQAVKEMLADLKSLKQDLDSGALSGDSRQSRSRELRATTRWRSSVQTELPAPAENRDKASASSYWRNKSGLGLAALLLLAVAVTLRVWPTKEPKPDSPHGIKITRLTNGGYIHTASLSPDGKYFAYTEQNDVTAQLWLRLVAGGQPMMLVPEIELPIPGLTFAPDGQAIYFVTTGQANTRGTLYRVPLLGGPVTRLLTGIISPVTFAPDGQQLAFIRLDPPTEEKGEGFSLILADLTGGNERILRTLSGLELFGQTGLSWSPDGKEIACQLMTGLTKTSDAVWQIVGVNVQTGAQRMLTPQQWDLCGRLVWLRDGRGIVIVGTKQGESATSARDSVWFISQPDGAVRRLTTDLDRHSHGSLSVTDDGQSLLVIPFNRTSQIWSVEARGQAGQAGQLGKTRFDAHNAVQLTTGTNEGRAGIVSLDDRLVYVARMGEHVDLWRMNLDGSEQQQLTTAPPFLEDVSSPSDGRYFVFASNRAGYSHLFRINGDGADLRQLTSGESREVDSDCSPDGHWIVYSSQSSAPGKIAEFKLWKIPAEGGTPVSLTDQEAVTPCFSPDSRWISYVYVEGEGFRGWRVAVIPADGGAPVKTFAPPRSADLSIGCRWTPDGQALVYVVKGKTFDNLWAQPLNGRAAYPLTDFNAGEIYNYAFARNGRQLFLAHGHSIRDVSLISDFR